MTLILASKSKARIAMLKNAGITFDSIPADINEEKIIADMIKDGASTGNIAVSLAREKALAISKNNPDKYIIGSDQLLSMGDIIYSKAKNKNEALERLQEFQGKEHYLTSGV
ncbi:MAG TPA: Maf family protein, partial [Alphaproteobacteria bacterium]|nr:Maf family protein [Alphaproteobacteria bacterium]